MKKILLTAALLASTAIPAAARLQITLQSGASTFSCFDGQLSCDQSGGANNLLIVDQTVGGVLVQIALTQSIQGSINELQLSSSSDHQRERRPGDDPALRQRHRLSGSGARHQ